MGDSWGEAEEGARRYPSAQSLSCNCRVTGSATDSHALHVVEESTAIRPYVLDGSAGEKTAKLTSNGASGATDDEPHEAAKTPRPGYKCHPHADRGTTRRMIEVLRFVVGLAADVVRRRAGSRRRERPASAAAHRGAAKDSGAGPVGTLAALHDGSRSTPGAGVARRHVARPAGDHPPLAPGRLSRLLAPTLSAVGATPSPARGASPRHGHQPSALGRG